jgi:hypothetical protein
MDRDEPRDRSPALVEKWERAPAAVNRTNNLRAGTRCGMIGETTGDDGFGVDSVRFVWRSHRRGGSTAMAQSQAQTQARDVTEVLNRDFLETRSRILEIAAALDRLDRASSHPHPGEVPARRLDQVRQAIEALLEPGPGRAETVQRLFSLDYDPQWQETHGMARRRLG